MKTYKPNKYPRKEFSTANKYQERIVFIAILPTIIIFLTYATLILLANPIITRNISHINEVDLSALLFKTSLIIIWVMIAITAITIAVIFRISHELVGPFGRIIREMDEVIEGKSKKIITSRSKDDLANDLLKRINVFVKAYVENKAGPGD